MPVDHLKDSVENYLNIISVVAALLFTVIISDISAPMDFYDPGFK